MTLKFVDISEVEGGTISRIKQGRWGNDIYFVVEKDGKEYDVNIAAAGFPSFNCGCEVDSELDISVTESEIDPA